MAWSNQARKRIRQNEKRRIANRSLKSSIKTHMKNATMAFQDAAVSRQDAEKQLSIINANLDKAARHHIIHRNKAARLKSKMSLALNKTKPLTKVS
ncbi:MAG: 30S ribosomal protein S20 [Planctomycetota bacterium]